MKQLSIAQHKGNNPVDACWKTILANQKTGIEFTINESIDIPEKRRTKMLRALRNRAWTHGYEADILSLRKGKGTGLSFIWRMKADKAMLQANIEIRREHRNARLRSKKIWDQFKKAVDFR